MIFFLKLLIFKYPNKRLRRYFNLKSRKICKSGAKLFNVKASVCVSLDGVGVSLKKYLKYQKNYSLKYISLLQLSLNDQ